MPASEFEKLPEMTHYVLGLLRRLPNRPEIPEEEANQIQEGHMANIRRLTELGEVITAGPFEEDGDVRGVLVFSTGSVERAKELTNVDPAILNGRLTIDFFTWFGPTGLRVDSHGSGPRGKDS